MTGRLLLGLAPFLLLAGTGAAAEAARGCDAAVAEEATVAQIVADLESWRGRCVEVAATSDGTMLFTGVDGFYGAGRLRPPVARDRRAGARIALGNPRLDGPFACTRVDPYLVGGHRELAFVTAAGRSGARRAAAHLRSPPIGFASPMSA